MKLSELNPRDTEIRLLKEDSSSKIHEMQKFSLRVEVWAMAEFATKEESNGLLGLTAKILNLEFEAVAKICFYLLKDKSDFIDQDDFINQTMCEKNKANHYKNLIAMYNAVNEVMGASQPDSEELERDKELKK